MIGPQKQLPAECATTHRAMRLYQSVWARSRVPIWADMFDVNVLAMEIVGLTDYPSCRYQTRHGTLDLEPTSHS